MEKCKFIITLLCLHLWLISCVSRRKKSEIIRTFDNQTGEATAVDHLIQKYENEHKKFYGEETQNGAYLEWPALDDKNLSNYCSKYLQHSVPTTRTDKAVGIEIKISLSYEKENTSIISFVVVLKCEIMKKNRKYYYYITRAPEPNCIYSLKRARNKRGSIFTIINKHCDFEEKPLMNKSLKRKRPEITSQMIHKTGQPLAKDEYLLQYEFEHQNMVEKEGKFIDWPYAMTNTNLDSYCYQYMGECAPGRNREGVTGSWKIDKLHYQKLNNSNFVDVTIITCVSAKPSMMRYYLTKAPEPNCVYALLLQRYNMSTYETPYFMIIFKYCNFENLNDQQVTSCNHDIPDEIMIPKSEVKEEPLDTSETLLLFPQD